MGLGVVVGIGGSVVVKDAVQLLKFGQLSIVDGKE